MFNLETEIENWCENLGIQGVDRDSSIDELKDHLHREIKKQQVLGLGQEEAFRVATEKIGDPDLLTREFQKNQDEKLLGRVVEGLSSNAIRVTDNGSRIILESSLQVPTKTLSVALLLTVLVLGIAIAGVVATSIPMVELMFVVAVGQIAYVLFEHWRGRAVLEITPDTIRHQFRLGPFTMSDNIYATEYISELEAKRVLPGYEFGVCRVQFKYGSRIRAFNVGYYNDEANYIIQKICESAPKIAEKASPVATTNNRSRLSNFVFGILALTPAPVFWSAQKDLEQLQVYYAERPELSVKPTTEVLFSLHPYFSWLAVYALVCTVPYILLITKQVRDKKLANQIEKLLVLNAQLTWAICICLAIAWIVQRL